MSLKPLQIELPLWSAAEAAPSPPADGESARRILLGEQWVPYRLRRGRRRRLTLTVDGDGLRIGAPLSTPLHEIESFALANRQWLRDKLDEWSRRPRRQVVAVVDGIAIPLLGRSCSLRVVAEKQSFRWIGSEAILVSASRPLEGLEAALRERAREYFLDRVRHYAALIGRDAPPVSVGAARTRWGSCSRSGIRLNWRLIHLPPEIVDYVVAHEVAHLREMNHSSRFWRLVESLCPNCRVLRAALREESDGLPIYR